ncbi:Presenilin-domain-containing protein [Mycotypha africana]|uniref:Presenilin-domain-containing protein n=1 Tax=Mycotypha africana TaxID=64632 RepID=UPI00230124E4|nr:Presenilin-domain-containing protein [Mycotypha africana]KAI8982351.1 Presenilin-domain-containing protein [Mycotypha africana]
MVVVSMLLGFMSYILILNLIQVFFIPLDYITMVFALWNFAIVGLVSIFWKGPLWLQQTYLTLMSSLMAFSLTSLEQWTTWILLGLLAIWDLIAVLCPFGPLKMLIESSKKQQREVPALLYSVNAVWFMAATHDHFKLSDSIISSTSAISLNSDALSTKLLRDEQHQQSNNFIVECQQHASNNRMSRDGFIRLPDNSNTSIENNPFATQHSLNDMLHENDSIATTNQAQPREDENREERRQAEEVNDDYDEDAERTGLKLGLGDFVFYSVLIARAAMYDWITTICCTVAVLTGLTATIFLLAIFKKALPALPISIAFGILYYFVGKTVLVPYVRTLCVFDMIGL